MGCRTRSPRESYVTGRYHAVGLLGALLALAPGPAPAQTADTPRTPWGSPDLGGVWDYRSATPMARPQEFRDRPVMTEEEAAALARQTAEWFESIDSGDAVPGHEIHTRVFLDFGTDPVPDRRTSLIVDPPTGRHPPAAAGAAERRAAVAGSFGPGPFDSCVPVRWTSTIPRLERIRCQGDHRWHSGVHGPRLAEGARREGRLLGRARRASRAPGSDADRRRAATAGAVAASGLARCRKPA